MARGAISRAKSFVSKYIGKDSKLGQTFTPNKKTKVTETTTKSTIEPVRSVDYQGKPKTRVYVDAKGRTYKETAYSGGGITIRGGSAWDIPTEEVNKAYSSSQQGKQGYFNAENKFVEGVPPEPQVRKEYSVGSLKLKNEQQVQQQGKIGKFFATGLSTPFNPILGQARVQTYKSYGMGLAKVGLDTGEFGASVVKTFSTGGLTKIRYDPLSWKSVKFSGKTAEYIRSYPTDVGVIGGYGTAVVAGGYALGAGFVKSAKSVGVGKALVQTGSQVFNPIQIKAGTYIYPSTFKGVGGYIQPEGSRFGALLYKKPQSIGLPNAEIGQYGITKAWYGDMSSRVFSGTEILKVPYIQIGKGGFTATGTATTRTLFYGTNFVSSGFAKPFPEIINKAFVETNFGTFFKESAMNRVVTSESITNFPNTIYGKNMFVSSPSRTFWARTFVGETITPNVYTYGTGEVGGKNFMTGGQKILQPSSETNIVLTDVPKSNIRYYSGGAEAQSFFSRTRTIGKFALGTITTQVGTMGALPSVTAISTPSVIPKTSTKTIFSPKSTLFTTTIPAPLLTTIPLYGTGGGSGTSSLLATTTISTTTTTTPTITPITPIIPPTFEIPPLIPPFPKFFSGFSTGAKSRKLPKKKKRSKYTPSYEALVFNIKGKAPKKITGLEVRPIPKGFKWSYNKKGF